ncbi:MAG: DNA mismatch repair protein MutS [Phycisphaerales bacterium]
MAPKPTTPKPTEGQARDPRDTPAMRQYMAFKKLHPECLLFFRIGDFYELFDSDAERASKLLGLTLTERSAGIPMAGVPFHQLETYLKRLVALGVRVAVADQLQTPEEARAANGSGAVIERGLTRVLTPGTLVDETLLDDGRPNNLAAVAFVPGAATTRRDPTLAEVAAVAIADLSTGRFTVLECPAEGPGLIDELARRQVSEVLYAETADGRRPPRIARVLDGLGVSGTPLPQWHFRATESREALLQQFSVATLAGFGLQDDDPVVVAAGALVRYLRQTQALDARPAGPGGSASGSGARRSLMHLAPPRREGAAESLVLDTATLRSLEIDRPIRGGGVGGGQSDGSLVGIFQVGPGGRGCRTAMGKRTVLEWLCRPSARAEVIASRHGCVGVLREDRRMAAELGVALAGVQDVPRIAARMALGRVTARDLVGFARSLAKVEAIETALVNVGAFSVQRGALGAVRGAIEPVAAKVLSVCAEHPPANVRDGGLVRDGVDAALDEARGLERDAGAWLSAYQARLAAEFSIPGLKVGYNKIFGYYIELPKGQAARAPEGFARRQTLTNAERYITPELKDFEEKVTTASTRALQRELAIFDGLCAAAAAVVASAMAYAETVAEIDALLCFADTAAARGWVAPEMVTEPVLDIRQGRHPVLNELLGTQFVPNDTRLGLGEEGDATVGPTLALITGPNMAGKSTYIRQTALLVLMAHAGSFVPAERALIGLTDRIFARVGADDALHAGQSTFMVEMTETANILHQATARSLVILDEIGRGTSPLDGLSLAWAIAVSVAAPARGRGTRALFATHYHEITRLAELLPGRVMNLHVAVREWTPGGGEGQEAGQTQIVFLHRILPGRTDRSYGLHVARLAGIPEGTVRRAREVLESLSVEHAQVGAGRGEAAAGPRPGGIDPSRIRSAAAPPDGQLSLFTEYLPHPVVMELKQVALDGMTPMGAFDELRRLKALAENDRSEGQTCAPGSA